jgi:hypothetical protein
MSNNPKPTEDLERVLNPHRDEQQQAASLETEARLRRRGIAIGEKDSADQLTDLLDAVERFEDAVEAHGGDLMVDDLNSSQPDDPHFVLPRRARDENVPAYIDRINQGIDRLRSHPRRPD